MEEADGIHIVVEGVDLVGNSLLEEDRSFAEVCLRVSLKLQNGKAVDSYG